MIDGGSGGNLVSRLDTSVPVTVTWDPSFDFAGLLRQLVQHGQIRLTSARGPDDDGLAGVLARI